MALFLLLGAESREKEPNTLFVTLPLSPALQLKVETRLTLQPVACLFGFFPFERPHILHLCEPWVQVVLRVLGPPHWHRASCVSSRSDASGARTSFSSSCSFAQDSVGVSHGFPSVKISLEAARPSSSSDWSSCPFHCHGADHFPFHWVPFHDHRDMSSAHQRKHLPAAHALAKKRHETRAHPSGLETIVHTCTYKEPIQQRTKLGKHGGRAIEVIKYYRAL